MNVLFSLRILSIVLLWISCVAGTYHRKRHKNLKSRMFSFTDIEDNPINAQRKELSSPVGLQTSRKKPNIEFRKDSLFRNPVLSKDVFPLKKKHFKNNRIGEKASSISAAIYASTVRKSYNDDVERAERSHLISAGNSRWTLQFQGMSSEHARNYTSVNETTQVRGDAFLPCKVGHLGDRQVSWIRNWNVLTSGKSLITQDNRFTVLHEPGSQDWILHIKKVGLNDTGLYECQVSTGTGVISMFVNLNVVIPEAFILGHGQYHVNRGSPISLTCVIRNSPSVPKYIFWHHNGDLLNFQRDRPEVTLTTKIYPKESLGHSDGPIDSRLLEYAAKDSDTVISRLLVKEANDIHSGNYSCSTANIHPASTLIFITEGDKTAAVQRIDSSARSRLQYSKSALHLIVIASILR